MAKNQAILEMLSALTFEGKTTPEKKTILAALDALVSGELDDVSSFRSHFIQNQSVFLTGLTSALPASPQDDDGFLSKEGDGDTNNLVALIHKAVEKRILLGLEGCDSEQLKAIVDAESYKAHRLIIKANPLLYGKRYEAKYFDSDDNALDAMTERAEEILDHIDRIENKKIDDLYFSYLSNKEKMRVDPALTLLQNKAKLDAINEQFSLFNKAILSASKVVSDSALLKINIEKRQQIIERFTI